MALLLPHVHAQGIKQSVLSINLFISINIVRSGDLGIRVIIKCSWAVKNGGKLLSASECLTRATSARNCTILLATPIDHTC